MYGIFKEFDKRRLVIYLLIIFGVPQRKTKVKSSRNIEYARIEIRKELHFKGLHMDGSSTSKDQG